MKRRKERIDDPFHLLGGLEGQLNAAGQRVGFLSTRKQGTCKFVHF